MQPRPGQSDWRVRADASSAIYRVEHAANAAGPRIWEIVANFTIHVTDCTAIEMQAIELELFRHLFTSIAEEMGIVLRKTSYSANIKERRDYSCAVYDAR